MARILSREQMRQQVNDVIFRNYPKRPARMIGVGPVPHGVLTNELIPIILVKTVHGSNERICSLAVAREVSSSLHSLSQLQLFGTRAVSVHLMVFMWHTIWCQAAYWRKA